MSQKISVDLILPTYPPTKMSFFAMDLIPKLDSP